jgi:hypothetical protein
MEGAPLRPHTNVSFLAIGRLQSAFLALHKIKETHMAATKWQISGNYLETCSCDFLCPCITANLAAQPSKGHCDAALVYHIERGTYDGVKLDDLSFAVLLHSPGVMAEGNISIGVITDERASDEQQAALVTIASGQAGGPMAALGPLVDTFLGAEAKPFHYDINGMSHAVSIPGVLDQACEGVPSAVSPSEPLYIENTVHPTNSRLALAKATRSHLHAFGIDWDDTSGTNNGHFAPFNWQGG